MQWSESEFQFEGCGYPSSVAVPEQLVPGAPWAWRPEFRDAFSAVDEELLLRGWHLLFLDLPDQYGSPFARNLFSSFLDHMIQAYDLAPKGVYIGLSRGGLSALHVAMDQPDRCRALYLDNPVCTFRSWPGGMGTGPGCRENWEKLLIAYGLTDEDARVWVPQPLNRLTSEFISGTPLALVGGLQDEVVPWETNGASLAAAWNAHNGHLHLETKAQGLHHPHGPVDPDPLVSFLENTP